MKQKAGLKTDTVKHTKVESVINRKTSGARTLTSVIRTYSFENGEIERVQSVSGFSWDELSFLRPSFNPAGFERITTLYSRFIVPRARYIFGRMVLFTVPVDYVIPKEVTDFRLSGTKNAKLSGHASANAKTLLTAYLSKNIRLNGKGVPHFRNALSKQIWEDLSKKGCLSVICGLLPFTRFLQVDSLAGFLSENEPDAAIKVNASFFVMDAFDVGCFSDRISTPLGLCVKDGKVLNPPLFDREALLVSCDGSVTVRPFSLSELTFTINGTAFPSNTRLFERPRRTRVFCAHGKYALIIGTHVDAVFNSGLIRVPESGFILKLPASANVSPGDEVTYNGAEKIKFGISVGNSILIDNTATTEFLSRFYRIRKQLGFRAFPPSLYPHNFEHARAPRIAIGADSQNNPVILWAEGPGKFGYEKGKGSVGASLSEMIAYCRDAGMANAVNLDGGGSAQILLNNLRSLEVSDRDSTTCSEIERAVPMGLFVK